MDKENLGKLILRLGLGFVFLWFGIDKFFHPLIWKNWIPNGLISMISSEALTFIYSLGVLESLVGLLLVIGLFTRIASSLAAVLLLGIIASFGINEIMIRDLGLLFSAIATIILGPGRYSVDWRISKSRKF